MSTQDGASKSQSVLVIPPLGREASATRRVLRRAGIHVEGCNSVEGLCRRLGDEVGAVIIAERALSGSRVRRLIEALQRQPRWAALPLVVLVSQRPGENCPRALRALQSIAKVTFLERAPPAMTLISAVKVALATRRRQYEVRELLHQLQEESHRRDEFLGILAHALRNPLAPIRNAVDLLEMRLRHASVDPVLRWGLDVIGRQTYHLSRVVDDLLDVARVTSGKIELRKEAIDLADVVARALEATRPLIEAGHQHLEVTLPQEPLRLRGDPGRLTQVVKNLLTNAAMYTPAEGHISLRVGREGRGASIEVADSGIGVSPELLPRIFDPFIQGDNPLEESVGLGLGLTLVRRLVEMHGGQVQASSAGPGHGSRFVVHLPAMPRKAAAPTGAPRETSRATAPPRPLRILVVDDNEDVATSLTMLLSALGHEVHVAHDGPTALTAAVDLQPDVVFLDIGLPRLDGYQVAHRLRKWEQQRDTLLVALTGYSEEEDLRRSKEAGFDHHLVKPAGLERIEQILASRRPGGA